MEGQNLSMRQRVKGLCKRRTTMTIKQSTVKVMPCEEDMKRRIKTKLVERFLNGIQTFPVLSKETEVIVES